MPRPLRHRFALSSSLAAVTVASAALTAAVAPAAAATPAAAGPASTAARVTAGAAGRTLLLLNGQQLALRRGPGGRPVTSLMAPATGGFSFIFITSFCQQASDVPAAALPYLGRGLDPNLFRVSALRQVERAGRLPVRVTYHGAGRPSLPGVTITRASGGTATGYLTASSAVRFGAALNRQFIADHAHGSYGTDGLFGGGLSIALAGVAPSPAGPPRFRPAHPDRARDRPGRETRYRRQHHGVQRRQLRQIRRPGGDRECVPPRRRQVQRPVRQLLGGQRFHIAG